MKTIILFTFTIITTIMLLTQNTNIIHATGGGIQIATILEPMIEKVITEINNNNATAALQELQNIKNELSDTYEVEEDEDEDEDDKDNNKEDDDD